MDGIIKCPICNHKAEFTIYSMPYGVEEEYILCNNCGYSYEFAYGAYRIYVVENVLFGIILCFRINTTNLLKKSLRLNLWQEETGRNIRRKQEYQNQRKRRKSVGGDEE